MKKRQLIKDRKLKVFYDSFNRMKKYAETVHNNGCEVIGWKYEICELDRKCLIGGMGSKVLLQVMYETESGNRFELKSYVEVPYDGRKKVLLIDFID